MATRSSSSSRAHKHESNAAEPQPRPFSLDPIGARQPLAMSVDALAQLCRTTANLQMAQQDLMQQVARLHDEAAEGLRHAQDYSEIVRIQSNLLTSCARAAMECCQDLMLAGMKLSDARLQPPSAVAEPEPATAASAAEAAMNAMAPAMQAWQQFLAMAANNGRNAHH